VTVPSTAIIGLKHLFYAFAFGADGILMIEGQEEIYEHFTKNRMIETNRALAEYGIETMRVRYSYVPLPTYKKAAQILTMFAARIKKFGPLSIEERNKLKEKLGI